MYITQFFKHNVPLTSLNHRNKIADAGSDKKVRPKLAKLILEEESESDINACSDMESDYL